MIKISVRYQRRHFFASFFSAIVIFLMATLAGAQSVQRELSIKSGGLIEISNLYGRVRVEAIEKEEAKVSLSVLGTKSAAESDATISNTGSKIKIEVKPQTSFNRIDLLLRVPERIRVKIETKSGEVVIAGNIADAEVLTDTGTIATSIPLDNLNYNFLWLLSRPRYLSDVDIAKVKEGLGGRFSIHGKYSAPDVKKTQISETVDQSADKKDKTDAKLNVIDRSISLNFTTARGIVLLNVAPSEVASDLQERPLTQAAKSIIQGGDSMLIEAIRRVSPKYFGDYLKTLPPRQRFPVYSDKKNLDYGTGANVKKVIARVFDANNRAIAGLEKKDFAVTERGTEREILSVEPTTTPFNLVLLLDVSGSIDNYVNFIRKAARNFLNTMHPNDKIAIVIFADDVKQIATFTTDRKQLSESLDSFDAGGGTAFYDAIAFSLVDTLKPYKGERTALVILTDGDDNRSFLPFESLLGSIQESGALIYPLYVPSSLVAAAANRDPNNSIDPLRTRYLGLTSKAEGEGLRLAQVSGGVYYPIKQIGDLQKAYEDIVVQLRTAYTVTFRSNSGESGDSASPRLHVKVNRDGTFVNLGEVSIVSSGEVGELRDYLKEGGEPDSISQEPEEITGDIGEIKYKALLSTKLQTLSPDFDINKSPPAFILGDFAFSRWVSPKRTRSYPYERIYNTLAAAKRATIIPVIKDEGSAGERDFIQFDTFSLMNLLDIYLILGYYNSAQRDSSNELTDQVFDNGYIEQQIKDLQQFKGTAVEWNLRQLKNISTIAEKAKAAYLEISKQSGVSLHDEKGIDNFVSKIGKSFEEFRTLSRQKSQKAQNREFQTIQPKEALSSDTKGRVTISDLSGGKYFFTCDETKIEANTLTLMEAKHSARAKLPAHSDIKDGLLKMMLYTNLKNVRVGSRNVDLKVALRLTSAKLIGTLSSNADSVKFDEFVKVNELSKTQIGFIKKLFEEARTNNFEVIFAHGETEK